MPSCVPGSTVRPGHSRGLLPAATADVEGGPLQGAGLGGRARSPPGGRGLPHVQSRPAARGPAARETSPEAAGLT